MSPNFVLGDSAGFVWIKAAFGLLDDLLAIHGTVTLSETCASLEMITSQARIIQKMLTGPPGALQPREHAKILRQMTETRAKMSKANLDTTVMDDLVASRMGVLNAMLSQRADKQGVYNLWVHGLWISS